MEIIKDLPEVFEEFAEQRQKSFLAVKQLKDKGIPVIGSYCTYFPKEIAMAMGAATVSLCSTSDETIPAAEKDLPRNLCPLIKSSYGFAKTDKCPFFYFSDVVVGETTCDGKNTWANSKKSSSWNCHNPKKLKYSTFGKLRFSASKNISKKNSR